MPGKPPLSDGLRPVVPHEKINASEENLIRDMISRCVDLPDSITDSCGTRMAAKTASGGDVVFIEITHLTKSELSFDMKSEGVALGKYVEFDTETPWGRRYIKDTDLLYDPDDNVVTDPTERYIYIGFIDQAMAGVPGQRYMGLKYGSKTCGEYTLPLVMINGGTPVTCVLAEDHPGCGVVFDVWIAPLWDPSRDSNNGDWDLSHATQIWDIEGCDDANVKFKAIDKRNGVPEPLKYATGLFAPRFSLTHGVLLEALEIDCTSPGSCRFCEAPA